MALGRRGCTSCSNVVEADLLDQAERGLVRIARRYAFVLADASKDAEKRLDEMRPRARGKQIAFVHEALAMPDMPVIVRFLKQRSGREARDGRALRLSRADINECEVSKSN